MKVSIFNRDKVSLIKQDGSRVDEIVSTVSGSNLIVIKGGKQIIDIGDLLVRKLSNGAEETYQVVDPKYYETTPGSTGPHYQLKVKKLGVPEAAAAVQHIVYNVSGNNSRVNVGSVDNSTNVIRVDEGVSAQIEILRAEVSSLGLTLEQQAESIEVLESVVDQFKSGKPKRSVVMALLNALPQAATIATATAKIAALL
ncbi:hypothetical protein [Pseudomonas paraveronii]|uniref:hypothetical protein n=1 Tax=Pseudomonas paraveronii TaxID=3040598 RepID=UPI002AB24146|nr:hypothetical protein [Pseudomonas sp. V3/K/3/5]